MKMLVRPLKGSYRNLTADNWFTGFDLVEYLGQKKKSYVHLFYNRSRDEIIIGFHDTGNKKSFKPAIDVLVVMARSIHTNW